MCAEKDIGSGKVSAGSTVASSIIENEKKTAESGSTKEEVGGTAEADSEEYPGGLTFALITISLLLGIFLRALDLVCFHHSATHTLERQMTGSK